MSIIQDLFNIKLDAKSSQTQRTAKLHEELVCAILKKHGFVEIKKGTANESIKPGLYFITQPNGSQRCPDIRLIHKKEDRILTMEWELKAGKRSIFWNDGYPKESIWYIYTDTYEQITNVYKRETLITDAVALKIAQFNDKIRSINEECKLAFADSTFKFYARKASQQYIDPLDYDRTRSLEILSKDLELFMDTQGIATSVVAYATTMNTAERKELTFSHDKLNAVSLFAGAGGDTCGMIQAGINVAGFIEIDRDAIQTHNTNHQSHLIARDVCGVSVDQLEPYINRTDIIFGGFPCQSFSHGGKKSANDSRGVLYKDFVRIAGVVRPKVIIGENVKGLLSRVSADALPMIDVIKDAFQSVGYNIKYKLIDCANFGVPQKRERLIIVGVRNDLPVFDQINIPTTNNVRRTLMDIVEFSLQDALQITKQEILDRIPASAYLEPGDDEPYAITGRPPSNLVKCHNSGEISFGKRSKSTYSCALNLDAPVNTILCTYNRMPRLFVPIKYRDAYYLRPFTQRELALIQGFSDGYRFIGEKNSVIKQIGNAIPPPVVKAVCQHIIHVLNSARAEHGQPADVQPADHMPPLAD